MLRKKISLTILGLFFCTACLPYAAGQDLNKTVKNTSYLALGDSLAFGLNPFVKKFDLSKYVGYPLIASSALHEKLANASCPGETSSTFVGTSTDYFDGFDCAKLRESKLFVPYNGASSQLEYASNYLAANPAAKLVTINLGVNDLAVLLEFCTSTYTDPAAVAACEQNGLPGVLNTYGENLALIFTTLRKTGYTGPVVFLNGFAYNYSDPVQFAAFSNLNQVLATVAQNAAFNVTILNAFRLFQVAATPFGGDVCKTGLLLKKSDGTCDTHPSIAGQALLAAALVNTVESLPKKSN
jgi:lysophospholipase L1-like esterase